MMKMLLYVCLCVFVGQYVVQGQGPMFKPDPRLSPQQAPNATLR